MWILEFLHSNATLPFASCVTLGNLLSLSFFVCEVGIIILLYSILVMIKGKVITF